MAKGKSTFKSSIQNFLTYLGGATPERLEASGTDDKMAAMVCGGALILVVVLEFCIYYGAFNIALPMASTIAKIVMASIVSLIIALMDSVIVHAHWYESGEAMLRQMDIDNVPKLGGRTWVMYAARITLAVLLAVTAANFFPDWTLANYLLPLPVQITNYSGLCENKTVTLKWSSASETNLAYYTIEKSADGTNLIPLVNIFQ